MVRCPLGQCPASSSISTSSRCPFNEAAISGVPASSSAAPMLAPASTTSPQGQFLQIRNRIKWRGPFEILKRQQIPHASSLTKPPRASC
ncbi:MAG: hypothetical protein Q8P67_22680 [archaeon]|nr:hypothetical protein [archaeon]